jgi:hypothetical protein
VPTEYEWNLTVERQLAAQMVGRFTYVGSHSINILETQDDNTGAANTTGNASTGYRVELHSDCCVGLAIAPARSTAFRVCVKTDGKMSPAEPALG